MRPRRAATLPEGRDTEGDDGVARLTITGRPALLGAAGRGVAAAGLAGTTVLGFATLGGRGFELRGGSGMRPSRPARD